jgi:hypothetical protein
MQALNTHAQTLAADAEALAACADRLRDLARRLRGQEAVPPWLYEQLNSQRSACTVAAADLTTAAARMEALAAVSGRSRSPRG